MSPARVAPGPRLGVPPVPAAARRAVARGVGCLLAVALTGCTSADRQSEAAAPATLRTADQIHALSAAVGDRAPLEQRLGAGAGRMPTLLRRVQIGVRDQPVTLRIACLDDQPLIVQLQQGDAALTERLFACDGRVLRLRAPAGPRDAVTFETSSEDSPGTYAYAWSLG